MVCIDYELYTLHWKVYDYELYTFRWKTHVY
jgi:hypothetical protein